MATSGCKCPKCPKCNVPPINCPECTFTCPECSNGGGADVGARSGEANSRMSRLALLSTLAGSSLIFLDSQHAGSFEKSATNKFLRDTGLYKLGNVMKLPYVVNQGGKLVHRATSISLKSVMRFFAPYIKFFFYDIFVILKSAVSDIYNFVAKNPTVASLALVTVTAALVIQFLAVIFPALGNAIADILSALANIFKSKKKKRRR